MGSAPVAGIFNLLLALTWALVVAGYALGLAIPSIGVSLLCFVCCLAPIGQGTLGVFELLSGVNMMNGKVVKNLSLIHI